jgi:hypothetical protein
MFLENIVFQISMAVILIAIVYRQAVVMPRRKRLEADQRTRDEFNAEMDRVERLPKLDTHWLMRVPMTLMSGNPMPRSYGTRYNQMLIIDEYFDGWVGLATPEILECLKEGEYVWHDYQIPFRGMGERFGGDPVLVDGFQIDIYPRWMSEGINLPDWEFWARIEKNFLDHSRNGWNYQSGLGKLNRHMEEFRNKRNQFNRLAKAVGMEAK